MKSSVAIIANPHAGSASLRKVELAASLFKEAGAEARVLFTEERGGGQRLAHEAVQSGAGLVVAAGGDGTVNEVANALAGTEVPMAVLPIGTTNVLAKEFGVPERVRGAVKRALEGSERDLYLGGIEREGGSRLFCMMAGVGFDAEAVKGLNREGHVMRVSGKAAHLVSGMGLLTRWSPESLEVTVDGKRFECSSLIVCNGAKYAGHIKVAPEADMSEPQLYAFLMHGLRRLDVLRYSMGILLKRHIAMRDTTYIKAGRVEVGPGSFVQADGDFLGSTPVVISAAAARLKLIA